MKLRTERDEDRSQIATLIARTYLENGAKLIEMTGLLRDLPAYKAAHGVIAEVDDTLCAYALFTPLAVGGSKGAVLLAPLAMDPERPDVDYNGFMHKAIDEMKTLGFKAVLMHGVAQMYEDDGFKPASTFGIKGSISYPGADLLLKPLADSMPLTGDVTYPEFLSKF